MFLIENLFFKCKANDAADGDIWHLNDRQRLIRDKKKCIAGKIDMEM